MKAFDFSYARPSPSDITNAHGVGVFIYDGNAIPNKDYVQSMLTANLWVAFIDEASATDAAGGYPRGIARAQAADAADTAAGYPLNCERWVVLWDTDRQDAANPIHLQEIHEFVRGYNDGTTRAHFNVYGSREAVDTAKSASLKVRLSWVPETWGFDVNLDAVMQYANTPSPIAATDWNECYTTNLGQWSLNNPVQEDNDMPYIAYGPVNGYLGSVAVPVLGAGQGIGPERWNGSEDQYGIPAAAKSWNNSYGRNLRYLFLDEGQMKALLTPTTTSSAPTTGQTVPTKISGTITGTLS